jgi:23S rRNA (adenine2030-N6)-methyltransferase
VLSYRHAFHAGNHADVLKHIVLVELLRYMTAKAADLWYIDTHAGAGAYDIGTNDVAVREAEGGIAQLWGAQDPPDLVALYLKQVARLNPGGALRRYPGSPGIAFDLTRPGDRLWLSELHPADHATLLAGFGKAGKRVSVEKADGYSRLKALLPPGPKRALVMIDPSYEQAAEYQRVLDALADARRRFATGVYAIWYPLLRLRESMEFPRALEREGGEKWLHARMLVRGPEAGGLFGSGMFIVNPPYTLAQALDSTLPWLTDRLAQGPGAAYSVASGPGHNVQRQ